MAAGMTKSQVVRYLAEKTSLSNKDTAAFLEQVVDLAVKEAKKNGLWGATRKRAKPSRSRPRLRRSFILPSRRRMRLHRRKRSFLFWNERPGENPASLFSGEAFRHERRLEPYLGG